MPASKQTHILRHRLKALSTLHYFNFMKLVLELMQLVKWKQINRHIWHYLRRKLMGWKEMMVTMREKMEERNWKQNKDGGGKLRDLGAMVRNSFLVTDWKLPKGLPQDDKDLSHIKGKHQTPLLPRSHVGQDWTLEDLLPPVQKAPKTSSGEFANQISNYKLQIIKVKYQISNIKFKLSNSNIKFIKFYKLDTLTIKRINYI